jgi:hypothetical protein
MAHDREHHDRRGRLAADRQTPDQEKQRKKAPAKKATKKTVKKAPAKGQARSLPAEADPNGEPMAEQRQVPLPGLEHVGHDAPTTGTCSGRPDDKPGRTCGSFSSQFFLAGSWRRPPATGWLLATPLRASIGEAPRPPSAA